MRRCVLFLGCLLSIAQLGCSGPSPRVLVIGLDGGDWDVILPLAQAGYLPTIGGIVDAGTRADMNCVPAWPRFACYCPPVWISIATGQPESIHRIRDLDQRSDERRSKTIWNVVADHGGSSTLLSWRNTWPPDEPLDWVLSEPGADLAAEEVHDLWKPLDTPGMDDVENLAQPSFLVELLGLVPPASAPRPAYAIFGRDRVSMDALERIVSLRRFIVPELGPSDLTMILLHSPDKSEHLTWQSVQAAPEAPIDVTELLNIADAWNGPIFEPRPFGFGTVASQYLEIDAWLGRFLEWATYDYIVFVSDHGMARNPGPFPPGHHNEDVPEAHTGIFSITGPGVRPGVVLDEMTVLDVAPTLAYVLGLPVSRGVAGRFLGEAFTRERLLALPPSFVDRW